MTETEKAAYEKPLRRPADDMSPWMAPYCMAPYCHNSRTAYYLTQPATGSNGVVNLMGSVVLVAPGPFPYGERLCRSHALLRHRTAIGG